MRFIDWLSVAQEHPEGGLPVVGREMVMRYDLQTGEVVRQAPNRKTVEGSYSSSLFIRCDGSRVSVEGNPSRWQRLDNLFGFQRFDDCIQVYNGILLEVGLPPFTPCRRVGWQQGPEDRTARRVSDGAIFKRVDWTRNLAVGEGNELPFLRALSSQSFGKGHRPYLYADGNTVDWGKGGTLWYQKVYSKAAELEITLKKLTKKLTQEEKEYLLRLIRYCREQGIVRDEREFKRAFLQRKNLCFYGMTKESDFNDYLTDVDTMIERLEMSTVDYETIADQLLERGICKSRQSANATQAVVLAWLHGQRMPRRSQYFEHKRRLRELGIDISVPYDASRAMPQLKRQRVIQVSTAVPPAWYVMPKAHRLRLVS